MVEFLQKPNIVMEKIGNVDIVAEIKSLSYLENTCSAMDMVANAEFNCGSSNDYTTALTQLIIAYDTFIREYSKNQEGKEKKPISVGYDLSNPIDWTIKLIWEFRNVLVHCGGLIDEKCKKNYEAIYNESEKNQAVLIIPLPKTLVIGYKFTIEKQNYYLFKNALFSFIGRQIPSEDRDTLRRRSGIANHHFDFYIEVAEKGRDEALAVSYRDMIKAGIKFDWKKDPVDVPESEIDWQAKRIIFKDSGIAVGGTIIPKNILPKSPKKRISGVTEKK